MDINKSLNHLEVLKAPRGEQKLEEAHLAHFRNPIGLAAEKVNFQPFTYIFDGLEVRIGQDLAQALLQIYINQLSICRQLVTQVAQLKLETDGEYSVFLSTPLQDLKLSTRLFHCLRGNDCNTMLDVVRLGKKGVSRIRGIGKGSLQELREVFIRQGCIEMFDY